MSAGSHGRARLRWDAVASLLVMGIAAVFLYGAWNLRLGTLARMGPGFVPIALGAVLLILGAVIVGQSLGTSNKAPPQFPALRPTLVVVLSPLLFSLLIGRIGLVLTVVAVTLFARLAQPQKFGLEMFLLPLLLTAFCVVVFAYLLSLPLPLWP